MATIAASPPTPIHRSTGRTLARWMVSFAGFPLRGLAASSSPTRRQHHERVAGGPSPASCWARPGWAMRADRRLRVLGLATALGLAAGLAIGASLVSFSTGLGDLAIKAPSPARRRPRAGYPLVSRMGRSLWPGRSPCRRLGRRLGRQHVGRRPGRRAVHRLRRRRRGDRCPAHRSTPRLPPDPPRQQTREPLMSRHVVFGTGQVGQPLVEQLVARGHDVLAVNRSGRGDFPGAQVVGGDATDHAFTTATCAGADVVYFAPNAATRAGARSSPQAGAGRCRRRRCASSRVSTISMPTVRRGDASWSRPWRRTPPRRNPQPEPP